MILGGLPALIGIGAGAESAGQVAADVELHVGVAHQQRLRVGVDGDELDTLQPGIDHAIHCIAATAADAERFLEESGCRWLSKPFRLGLDLQGGTRLVYKFDFEQAVKDGILQPGELNRKQELLQEFATIIRELAGSSAPIIYTEPAVGDDPQRRRPDIEEWQEGRLFPRRETAELTYELEGEWGRFFQCVLDYCASALETSPSGAPRPIGCRPACTGTG